MGYRSDVVALETRRAVLSADIARLEPQVEALTTLAAELDALRRERKAIDARLDRWATSWMSGVEWIVVAVVALALLGLVAVAVLPGHHRCGHWPQTRSDAQAVRSAVLLYLGQEPGADCPTLADLERVGTIDHGRRTTDVWNRPFRIECDGDDIRVISAGPDGVFGTDDIE